VPVGGVRYDAHGTGRFAEHHGVRATRPGQLDPGGDQAVADRPPRPSWPLRLARLG
jgi:hypothetical protein